jgi:Predicted endonuclease distantly related to archaeal Holliday junction resolvase
MKELSSNAIGKKGELIAINYLKENKQTIIATNFHSYHGEIDIITKNQNNLIIFIEVKYYNNKWIKAIESITRKKKQCLILTAKKFMSKYQLDEIFNYRFDLIIIKENTINNHIENIIDC